MQDADETKENLDLIYMLFNILENTKKQAEALNKSDFNELKRLLSERQALVDALISSMDNADMKSSDSQKAVLKDAYAKIKSVNDANIIKAESLSSELAKKISNIRQGRNAFKNGYLKKTEQAYGYFIDKKFGA